MSKSGWIVAATLGLIATLGAAQDQPATENQPSQNESAADRQDERDENQTQTADLTSALKSIESAIRDLESEVDEVEQNRQRDANQRDLEAQEAMAHWAKLMFYAAFASTFLTALALWAIIRTLHHTKRAAVASEGMLEEARATTAAAKETIKVTRAMGEAQTKAYITVKGVEAFINEERKAVANVHLINTGASPAFDVEITVKCEIIASGFVPEGFDANSSDALATLKSLPPNTTIETDARTTPPFDMGGDVIEKREIQFAVFEVEEISMMTAAPSNFFVHVEVKFLDVFGNRPRNRRVFFSFAQPGVDWLESRPFVRWFHDHREDEKA